MILEVIYVSTFITNVILFIFTLNKFQLQIFRQSVHSIISIRDNIQNFSKQ
jgi:hypothetical protein